MENSQLVQRLEDYLRLYPAQCGGMEYAVMWLQRGDFAAAAHYLNRVDPDKVLFYPVEVRQLLREAGLWTFPDAQLS